jgi:predicted nucleotidyltransferase
MGIEELLGDRRAEILEIAERHGAHNVRVFGSAARGDASPSSDIDFLVEMDSDRSLLDQVGLIQDLEDLLARPVDVVEPGGVHWYIRDRVLQESIPL